MVIAIIIGYLAGALVAFYLSKRLLGVIADRFAAHQGQQRSIKLVGAIFGAISLAPAIFMAMMIGGGGLAGHYAGTIAAAVGLGEGGALPVLSLGMMVIITITVITVAVMGACMGVLGSRSLDRQPSGPSCSP